MSDGRDASTGDAAVDTAGEPASATPGARVHDLGYKRYTGTRRAQRTRYRVIGKKLLGSAWRGWWRMKLWVVGACLVTFVSSVLMYVSEGVSRFLRDGQKLPLADALLPMSWQFFQIWAFALSMTVLAAVVANDMRTGAFEFYFSRPVRTRDYVLGKVLGAVMIMGSVLFLGPLALAIVRLGLSEDVAGALHLLPKAALVGALATAAYAVVPLTFSAISSNRMHTIPAWGAFYFMTTIVVRLVSRETGILELEALNIPRSILTLAYAVFDVVPMVDAERPSATVAVAGLLGYVVVGLAVLLWRVSAAEKHGMGGA